MIKLLSFTLMFMGVNAFAAGAPGNSHQLWYIDQLYMYI